jgi:hypothetical protein
MTEEAWSKDMYYDAMLTNLKMVLDKKPSEGTPFKRELMLRNELIMVAFGSLNENRPQELLLVLLHQYPKLPDHSLKIPRYIKLGEVWSVMFRIKTGLYDGQHRMLTWLCLVCSFDDDIFEGDKRRYNDGLDQ